MLSNRNLIGLIATIDKSPIELTYDDVHLSYLPLAHVLERVVFIGLMAQGAQIGFYQGDVLKIKEDLLELRPTLFVSVPRLYTKLYDTIQGRLSEATGLKKKLANMAIKSKMNNLQKTGSVKSCLWDKIVFNKMKAALGGRVRICVTGSAPISKEVMNFLKIAFCCPIIEGYGQTETTAASCCTLPNDPETGHVGGVLPSSFLKLVDVPDMDYLHTDKKDGETYPRGEICFKGSGNFEGYFMEPEKTKETIDKDGWVHTGDIGEIQPNGALRIIDRKKNIFKLSQGEYIAAEKLELLFAKSPLIAQVFVYGDSLQSYLVTIIVPDRLEVEKNHGDKIGDYHEHINSDEFKKKILVWFQVVKKEEKLTSLEIPKKIYCTEDEFKVEDGTLTPTFKLIRAQSKKKFIDEIREMYDGEKLQGE
jgi:long-chain acyl-CoA synthetase